MSKRTIVILLLLLLASSLLYVFPKVAKLKFELMPFIFCLIDIVVVYLFYRAALYDISSNLLNVYERRSEYGCVAIDVKYRYLGANKFAREIFPYLENIRIDSRMNMEDENIFCETVLPWLDNWINVNGFGSMMENKNSLIIKILTNKLLTNKQYHNSKTII